MQTVLFHTAFHDMTNGAYIDSCSSVVRVFVRVLIGSPVVRVFTSGPVTNGAYIDSYSSVVRVFVRCLID